MLRDLHHVPDAPWMAGPYDGSPAPDCADVGHDLDRLDEDTYECLACGALFDSEEVDG